MNEVHRARRGHDFWPAVEVLEAIPALYATEDTPEREKVVHLHYFVGGCDWWVVELDSIERPQLAFGYVCLGDPQMAEWGYIDLMELAEVFRPPLLIVERDLGWTPRPGGGGDPPPVGHDGRPAPGERGEPCSLALTRLAVMPFKGIGR